jgi:hypothetical protein
MPFSLKNAGATYQRMMQNCLGCQIGCNIQVYIDDMVITTRKEESLISDLAETFDNLNRYKLKLNPKKMLFRCISRATLGVPSISKRNRGKPRKNSSNIDNGKANKATRRTEVRGAHRNAKLICSSIGRQSTTFLCAHEKIR